jgi:hypothetical protein
MLFRGIARVYCENRAKHKYIVCKNVEILDVTAGGLYSYQWL